ncbi:MAG: hypothetical protein H0T49_07640 [Chloroflexia bacterium]|nr:hypothetical protein [Chloroflexia bacterium]
MLTDSRDRRRATSRAFQVRPQLVAGVTILAIAWTLAWTEGAPLREFTFFPLWLGYILTVDGIVAARTGTSLLCRGSLPFLRLFLFSAPLWWLFEFANQSLGNWHYVLPHSYGDVEYVLLASISFSTVIPAVFETAELYRSFTPFARSRTWLRLWLPRTGLMTVMLVGIAMFALSVIFPGTAFPLVWIGLFLTIDPANALLGGNSISSQVAKGRWDTVLVLFAAGLTCGVFWEMWNYWSMPKWTYDVPYLDRPLIFEMPLAGYGGYLPFALEVYAAYQLLVWVITRRPDKYLRFEHPSLDG